MSEPIAVMVRRYRCTHCSRSHASRKRAVEHIGRCWQNPAARGCKTCVNFRPLGTLCCGQAEQYGCFTPMCPTGDGCAADVDIQGGPIVGCDRWAPRDGAS